MAASSASHSLGESFGLLPGAWGSMGHVRADPPPPRTPDGERSGAPYRSPARRRPRRLRRARLRRHVGARAGARPRRQPQPHPPAHRLQGRPLVARGRPRVRGAWRSRWRQAVADDETETTWPGCGRWSCASSRPTPPGRPCCGSSSRRRSRRGPGSTTSSTATSTRSGCSAPTCWPGWTSRGEVRTDSVALLYFFMTHGAGGPARPPGAGRPLRRRRRPHGPRRGAPPRRGGDGRPLRRARRSAD